MHAKDRTQTTGATRTHTLLPTSRPVPVMGRLYADFAGPLGLISKPLSSIRPNTVVTVRATVSAVNRLSGDRAHLVLANEGGDTALVTLDASTARSLAPVVGMQVTVRGTVASHTASTVAATVVNVLPGQAVAL
ncbi:hypothetical protein [Streptomyces sp. NEAU-H3]|uniref:hypothetical protein n=1 Tax=Streptomyces sp. NEAU-H3 TaxID=2720636 RepID=UPI00143ADDDE|nr:hypothetical protein [Streptomyces sp. NEAU-H3]NJA56668.1 hypothetical protein [Streptomyces sp. NEAU-H3]